MKAPTYNWFRTLPEIYLIAVTMLYWYGTGIFFNPAAILMLLFLSYQLYYGQRSLGLLLASAVCLIQFYLIISVLNGNRGLEAFNLNGEMPVWYLVSLLMINLIFSSWMLFNYLNFLPDQRDEMNSREFS